MQDLFDDDELTISRETTAHDVEAWDSMMHVGLVMRLEQEFGIRFIASDVSDLENVGELADVIDRYVAKAH